MQLATLQQKFTENRQQTVSQGVVEPTINDRVGTYNPFYAPPVNNITA
jgi:hypothetical protein